MIMIGLAIHGFIYDFYLRMENVYKKKDVIIMAYSKQSQEAYRKKSLQFTCSYRPGTDLSEGQRLKAYLTQTGQSANAYIKQLIKQDMDRRSIPYPSTDGISPDDNPTPTSDGIDDNNDRLPWEESEAVDSGNSGTSAWDIMEQIARQNGYKG